MIVNDDLTDSAFVLVTNLYLNGNLYQNDCHLDTDIEIKMNPFYYGNTKALIKSIERKL